MFLKFVVLFQPLLSFDMRTFKYSKFIRGIRTRIKYLNDRSLIRHRITARYLSNANTIARVFNLIFYTELHHVSFRPLVRFKSKQSFEFSKSIEKL